MTLIQFNSAVVYYWLYIISTLNAVSYYLVVEMASGQNILCLTVKSGLGI